MIFILIALSTVKDSEVSVYRGRVHFLSGSGLTKGEPRYDYHEPPLSIINLLEISCRNVIFI